MGGKVIEIESEEHWEEILKKGAAEKRVVFVDFSADWCGPCKMISPIFEDLSTKHTEHIFVKVDVDTLDDVAHACNISAMPTFQAFANGKKVDELVGAAKDKLIALCQKHAT